MDLLKGLDWHALVELACQQALTAPAQIQLRLLGEPSQWASTPEQAAWWQTETQEARGLLDKPALWGPLSPPQGVEVLAAPEPLIERLERGAALEIAELALIRRWIRASEAWRTLPQEDFPAGRFRASVSGLPILSEPARELARILTDEDELSERASPKLAEISQSIREMRRTLATKLDQTLKEWEQKGVLQDTYTDVRDGRYVLPVRISAQSEIEGVFHEASVSKQTVFVEPADIAPMNNKLRQLHNARVEEIARILAECSRLLSKHVAAIKAAVVTLSHWDAVRSKARLARRYGGQPLALGASFVLRDCANPLLYFSLEPAAIVTNDLEWDSKKRCLLLTGPNTGGKTVFLKTLGLASIASRTGFAFPCAAGATVPWFDQILADLGDEQSIEASISTFSGHLIRIREFLSRSGPRTLLLLDELASATDPEEGAALSRALVEHWLGQGAWLVATTHDPRLKSFALSDDRILAASLGFDEASSKPQYRVRLGVVGRSRALETAQRLGLPEVVLTSARQHLAQGYQRMEEVLERLERDLAQAAREKEEAGAALAEADSMRKQWLEKTQNAFEQLVAQTRMKLRRVLDQAQVRVQEHLQRIEAAKTEKAREEARRELSAQFKSSLNEIEGAVNEAAPELATPTVQRATGEVPQPGDRVRVLKWKSIGEVMEILEERGQWRAKVALGKIQMVLSADEIELIKDGKKKPALARVQIDAGPSMGQQIDLRGMRFEDAMGELERYLDSVFRSRSYTEVYVIHGLGTGALREGTRALLGKLPYIRSHSDGGAAGGGAGATRVELEW